MPYGPCIVCGAINYPLSLGGPSICPSCDCGPPSPRQHRELKENYNKLLIKYLTTEQGKTQPCPSCAALEERLAAAVEIWQNEDNVIQKLRELLIEKGHDNLTLNLNISWQAIGTALTNAPTDYVAVRREALEKFINNKGTPLPTCNQDTWGAYWHLKSALDRTQAGEGKEGE